MSKPRIESPSLSIRTAFATCLVACRKAPIFVVTMVVIGLCLGTGAKSAWREFQSHHVRPRPIAALPAPQLASTQSAPVQLAAFSPNPSVNTNATSSAATSAKPPAAPYDVARVERVARAQWAKANPTLARAKAPSGSYLEVAHLVQKSDWVKLAPVHRSMIRNLVLDARKGTPGVMPCFAPGTSRETMRAFEGVSEGLEFFRAGGPYWSNPSSGSHTPGTPMTLRWSVVADGTTLPSSGKVGEVNTPSDLKARLNAIYGNETVWRPLFRQIFARYSALSGITYIEETDDGAAMTNSPVERAMNLPTLI